MQLPLRKRMLLGTGIMLLPLLLLGALGYWFYLQTISSFDKVINETLEVMVPLTDLHRRVLQATLPIDNHFIFEVPGNMEAFTGLAHLIDEDFEQVIRFNELGMDDKQVLIQARSAWSRARVIGQDILQINSAGSSPLAIDKLARFDGYIRDITNILDSIHQAMRENITAGYREALRTREQIQILLMIAFLVGVIAAIMSGNALARQILNPLDKLKEGTERFGAGDLRFRIEVDDRDELGQLAATFNSMANELEFLATRDGLTGLLNKREFDIRLKEEAKRAMRERHPFALLLLDLDFFKQVNDTHGHQAGDNALRLLAALLKKQVREVDLVGRYGGEEFALLLTNTSELDALETAQRIIEMVAATKFNVSDTTSINMTISIGLAMFPDDATTIDVLVSCADQALYKAKANGRNQVVCFNLQT